MQRYISINLSKTQWKRAHKREDCVIKVNKSTIIQLRIITLPKPVTVQFLFSYVMLFNSI